MGEENLRSRFRRDFSKEIIHSPSHKPARPKPRPTNLSQQKVAKTDTQERGEPMFPAYPAQNHQAAYTKPHKWRGKKIFAGLVILLILAGGAIAGGYFLQHRAAPKASASPVPANIAQSVNFPIYYPDPKKLPAGYTLNLSSFSNPVKGGVLYSVNYGSGQKIVFSVQAKPNDNTLDTFNATFIPVRTDHQTPIGRAEIGAYNKAGKLETLVSLPTNGATWLVVTAPADINQDQLKQVLQSLRQ